MNKAELVEAVATRMGCPKKEASATLDAVGAAVTDALKNGEEVTLPLLGTFKAAHKPKRTGRNPATGEVMTIPAKTVPQFKVMKTLKDALL